MELLILTLNKEEYLEKILSILIEAGISQAVILESEALGHFLAYKVPIFAGLRYLVGKKKSQNKTILALIENKEDFLKFKKILAEENIDFAEPGMGMILTLPVNEVIKPSKEI